MNVPNHKTICDCLWTYFHVGRHPTFNPETRRGDLLCVEASFVFALRLAEGKHCTETFVRETIKGQKYPLVVGLPI